MRFRVVILTLLSTITLVSNAQLKKGIEYSSFFDSYYWRGPLAITGGLGLAVYSGDLCSDLSCSTPSPYFSLGVGYKVWPRVFVGGEIDLFKMKATDTYPNRGFEFTSKNTEIAGYVNLYLREDIVRRHNDLFKETKLFKPYVYLGLSALRYNVTSNANETNFPKTTLLVPVGLGAMFDITHRINLKIEGIYKISSTDYLDGVSELANPDINDGFGLIRAKIVYIPMAKRMKPKKTKISDEEKVKLNQLYQQQNDSTKTKPVVEPDPEEEDPYYMDEEPEEEETDTYPEEDGFKEEEEPETEDSEGGWDW